MSRSASTFRQALVAGAQTGVAAGIAWWIASAVLPGSPAYAPVAAVAVLGGGYDRRLERVWSMLGGMAIAIILSEIGVRALPTGVVWIALMTGVAIVVARVVLDDTLAVVYAGFNTPILFALGGEGWVPTRGIEALIGAATAFALVYLVFPPRAIRYAQRAIDRQVSSAVDSLRLASAALDPAGSREATEADELSEAIDQNVDAMKDAFGFAFEVAQFSPWRRSEKKQVEEALQRVRRLEPFLRTSTTAVRAANRLAVDGTDAHLADALELAGELVAVVGEVARSGESEGATDAEARVGAAAQRVIECASAPCGNDRALHMVVTELVRVVADDGQDLVIEMVRGAAQPRHPDGPATADGAGDVRRD